MKKYFLYILIICFSFSACKKIKLEGELDGSIEMSVTDHTLYSDSITVHIDINNIPPFIKDFGICWSHNENPDFYSDSVSSGLFNSFYFNLSDPKYWSYYFNKTSGFHSIIAYYKEDTTYYIRSFVYDGENVEYSSSYSINTFQAWVENNINYPIFENYDYSGKYAFIKNDEIYFLSNIDDHSLFDQCCLESSYYYNIFHYDQDSNKFSYVSDLTIRKHVGATFISYPGNIVIYHGDNYGESKIDVVNTSDYSESMIDNFPGPALYNACGFHINNNLFIGLGLTSSYHYDNYNVSKAFYKYDITNDLWNTLPIFPGDGRGNASVVTLNDDAYIGFGKDYNVPVSYNYDEYNSYFSDFWKFSSMDNTWTRLTDLPVLLRETQLVIVGSRIYLFGRTIESGNSSVTEIWSYNISDNTWTKIGEKSNAHSPITSVINNNDHIYLFYVSFSDIDEYLP